MGLSVGRTMIVSSKQVLLVLAFSCALILSGCRPAADREAQGPPLRLSIGVRPSPDSGLIALAEDRGYFREAGVEVVTVHYPSGRLALEATARGEHQLATVADMAFASKLFQEPSLRVVASIGFSTASQIVARRDRHIEQPSDLKGRRVGYSPDTTSDYFLYTFLLMENIPLTEITAVPIPPDMQAESVVQGDVDAVSAFDVYAYEAAKRLGERGIAWDCQSNLGYQWLLASTESVTQSPEPLKRFLRALIRAESFALAHPSEAMNIIIRKWGLDSELERHAWSRVRLSVSFGQSVITSLRNYIQWKMLRDRETGVPPDVLDFIHTGALEDVAPNAVTVFR